MTLVCLGLVRTRTRAAADLVISRRSRSSWLGRCPDPIRAAPQRAISFLLSLLLTISLSSQSAGLALHTAALWPAAHPFLHVQICCIHATWLTQKAAREAEKNMGDAWSGPRCYCALASALHRRVQTTSPSRQPLRPCLVFPFAVFQNRSARPTVGRRLGAYHVAVVSTRLTSRFHGTLPGLLIAKYFRNSNHTRVPGRNPGNSIRPA